MSYEITISNLNGWFPLRFYINLFSVVFRSLMVFVMRSLTIWPSPFSEGDFLPRCNYIHKHDKTGRMQSKYLGIHSDWTLPT